MPRIDESDQDVGNEPPFVARKVVIKKGQNPKLDYTFSDELGRGRFGTVLKCTEKKTGLHLAAKFVSTKHKEERENVEREVDIMKSLQHRRLLQLYDVYDDGTSEMCIITELINGGELFERVIDDDFELTEKVCAIFMRQIIEGVEYMHGKYIMHLDMKPENVLCVSRTGNRIKLIDFGLARRFDPGQKLQVMFGTPDFAAPEVLSYERVTPASDMWSVGVICYVLLSGLSPFMGNSDLETMTNVTRAIYDFDDESFDPITRDAKDFISKLLLKDPKRRLTPAESLQHKWLAKTALVKKGKVTKLSKTKLKKYVVRRRWQKAVTAIMALTRMGANLSLAGAFGGSATGDRNMITTTKTKTGSAAAKTSTSTTSKTTTKAAAAATAAATQAAKVPAPGANRIVSSYSTTSSTSSSSAHSGASPTHRFTPSTTSTTTTTKSTLTSTSRPTTPTTTTSTLSSRPGADPTSRLASSAASSSSYRVTSSSSSSSSSYTTRRRY